MNKSSLLLPVTLKVEGEFSIFTSELMHCDKVKFDLEGNESRDIIVYFNKNLLNESEGTAQCYQGKIRAFSLGKQQYVVNLSANIIYPSVEISSCQLNIINDMLPKAFTFTITNNGSIDSSFKLKFNQACTFITKIHERRQEKLLNIVQCMMKQQGDLREKFFMADPKIENIVGEEVRPHKAKEQNVNELHELNEIKLDTSEKKSKKKPKTTARSDATDETHKTVSASDDSMLDIEEFLLRSVDQEVTAGDVHKYFKNLTRGLSEILCNGEAKSEVPVETTHHPKIENPDEKLLKLSQCQGTLQPQESRLISIYLSENSKGKLHDIELTFLISIKCISAYHLSTVLSCEVIGGAAHDIFINITNCNPNLLLTKTYFEVPADHVRITDKIILDDI